VYALRRQVKNKHIHPKPNTSYPLLRLPQALNDFVGKTTHISETEHDDHHAFLVFLDKSEDDAEQSSSQVMQAITQPEADVTQQYQRMMLKFANQSSKAKLKRLKSLFTELQILATRKLQIKL